MTRTILVVEDDLDIQKTYQVILGDEEGYIVNIANNGQEALEFLEEHNTDLIILDWLMPIANGQVFLEELHKKGMGGKFPILLVAATDAYAPVALNLGVTSFLSKPFNIYELIEKVEGLITKCEVTL